MHTYTYTYIHTYMHTYIHAYIHTYITLHYITLHYITLHYLTLHYITLHYITLHYITLHYITLHYIHTYIHTYTYRYINICIYICILKDMYVRIYLYLYIHVQPASPWSPHRTPGMSMISFIESIEHEMAGNLTQGLRVATAGCLGLITMWDLDMIYHHLWIYNYDATTCISLCMHVCIYKYVYIYIHTCVCERKSILYKTRETAQPIECTSGYGSKLLVPQKMMVS